MGGQNPSIGAGTGLGLDTGAALMKRGMISGRMGTRTAGPNGTSMLRLK